MLTAALSEPLVRRGDRGTAMGLGQVDVIVQCHKKKSQSLIVGPTQGVQQRARRRASRILKVTLEEHLLSKLPSSEDCSTTLPRVIHTQSCC